MLHSLRTHTAPSHNIQKRPTPGKSVFVQAYSIESLRPEPCPRHNSPLHFTHLFVMLSILCFLLIHPFLVFPTRPNIQRLSKFNFECSLNYPAPSSPVSCSILIARVLANPWAHESRSYSRFEPQDMPTHLPLSIRYHGCQFTLSLARGREDSREKMVLTDYYEEMTEMIDECIVAGFPGVSAHVGPTKGVQMAICGEWDPLARSAAGNVTTGLSTSKHVAGS